MNDNDLQTLATAKVLELRADARQARLARLTRQSRTATLPGDGPPSHPRLDRLVGRARAIVLPRQRSRHTADGNGSTGIVTGTRAGTRTRARAHARAHARTYAGTRPGTRTGRRTDDAPVGCPTPSAC